MAVRKIVTPVCIDDFEVIAKAKLPKFAYDYYRSGADDEITLDRNVDAYKNYGYEAISTDMNLSMFAVCSFGSESIYFKNRTSVSILEIEERFSSLKEPCQIRRENLNDASTFYKWLSTSDHIASYLDEKYPLVFNETFGESQSSTQQYIHKHQQLCLDLKNMATNQLNTLKNEANAMISNKHFASRQIKDCFEKIPAKYDALVLAANERGHKLQESLKIHTFSSMVESAACWLNEKKIYLDSVVQQHKQSSESHITNYSNQTVVENSIKKLEVLESECKNFMQNDLTKLSSESEKLIADLKYLQATNVQTKMPRLSNEFSSLQKSVHTWKCQFMDTLKIWINEMHTKLVSTELGKNSKEAEYCSVQHKNEYGSEIDARQTAVDQFVVNGNQMIQAKHLLADEIEEKVAHLGLSYKNLKATWRERLDLYELNLDVQLWKEQAGNLESFLQENKSRIVDESDWSNLDDNILNIERKLVEHNDFLTLLEGQKNRVDNVKRLTMLEKAFGSQLDRENSRKMSENVLKEKLRKEQIRTIEKQKVLQERRNERERRRTQEIHLFRPPTHPSASSTLTSSGSVASNSAACPSPRILRRRSSRLTPVAANGVSSTSIVRCLTTATENLAASSSTADTSSTTTSSIVITVPSQPQAVTESSTAYLENKIFVSSLHLTESGTTTTTTSSLAGPSSTATTNGYTSVTLPRSASKQNGFSANSLQRKISGNSTVVEVNGIGATVPIVARSPSTHSAQSSAAGAGQSAVSDNPSAASYRKPVRRTATFSTRRQTTTIKKSDLFDDLLSIEKAGYLECKQTLQSGGKRAAVRSWKMFYTVLCGQLICFFKDEQQFVSRNALRSPLYILGAQCRPASEYHKKKNVIRLNLHDGSEYLFSSDYDRDSQDWVQKIGYHAGLPPNQQLKRFQPSSTVDRFEVPQQSPPPPPPAPQPPSRPQRSSSLTDGATTSIIVIEDGTSATTPLTPTKNAQRRPAPQPPASSTTDGAKENDSGFLSSVDEHSRKATTSDSPFATPGLPNVPSNCVHSTPLNGNDANDVFVPGVLKYDRNGVQNGGGKDFASTKVVKMREKSQTLPPVGSSNGARKFDHSDSLDSKSISGDTSDGSSSVEVDKKKKRSSKIGQFFRTKIRESPKEINE